MNKLVESLDMGYTKNGALTYKTSLNKCLDLFFVIGCHNDYSELFWEAYKEDAQLALRILFWSRDCRGGAGARRTFQEVIKVLSGSPEFSKVLKYIPEFGYWKDLFKLSPTKEIADFIIATLKNENDHSLCAKYCPRKGLWFGYLRNLMHMSARDFRHYIVYKTQVVEQLMCANKWSEIEYSSVPSLAGLRYSKLFLKHDPERYKTYIDKVNEGKEKINASVLYPHEIFASYITDKKRDVTRALWNALPNYMQDCNENILPICDVSGSMIGLPMNISVSLGCYISERNTGDFKDCIITFSQCPEFVKLTGSIDERFAQLRTSSWGFNTNLRRVFDLILKRAVMNEVPKEDMPTKLLIISDMELDDASPEYTNFEAIKQKYAASGYEMPTIIFWNVNGRLNNIPVQKDEKNVALVSGYSPSILTHLLKGEVLTPMQIMLDTVNSERYQCIRL